MSPSRTRAFDALRGLAAVCVVLTHYLAAFVPRGVFGASAERVGPAALEHPAIDALLLPPFSLLGAAHFSVCLFFVLSGYVLSQAFVARPDWRRLVGAAIKRGPRLAGVVLVSIALAIVLMQTGALHDEALLPFTGSRWLAGFWDAPFLIERFAHDAIRLKAGAEYVPPLWTLKVELIGSALVFALLALAMPLPAIGRHVLFAVALWLTWGSYYDGFVAGVWLAWLAPHLHGRPGAKAQPSSLSRRLLRVAALALVLAGAALPYYAAPALWPAHLDLPYPAALLHQIPMMAAMGLFALVLTGPALRRPLERRWLVALGEQSYALYATHFLVLGSLSAWLVVTLSPGLGVMPAMIVSALLSLPVLWAIAYAVTRWVDEPSVALAGRLDRACRAVLERLWPRTPVAA